LFIPPIKTPMLYLNISPPPCHRMVGKNLPGSPVRTGDP
jgi:hypothetical protein